MTEQNRQSRKSIHKKAEARDEWDKLCAKLDELTSDYEPLKEAVEATGANVLDALTLVASEVQDGFERIRKTL